MNIHQNALLAPFAHLMVSPNIQFQIGAMETRREGRGYVNALVEIRDG